MYKGLLSSSLLLLIFLSTEAQELNYSIFPLYSKPITKRDLATVKTMKDINPGFPESWIAEKDYISSVVTVTKAGSRISSRHINHELTKEQKSLINNADLGTNIEVEVTYNARNSVTQIMDEKTMNFSVTVIPDKEAAYIGGHEKLEQIFKKHVIDQIESKETDAINNAILQFVIDTQGQLRDPQITISSGISEIDNLLLQAVDRLGIWTPAINANGEKVSQTFQYQLSNMDGC
jgi:TonB family protein